LNKIRRTAQNIRQILGNVVITDIETN
jgi:hypothetical protein